MTPEEEAFQRFTYQGRRPDAALIEFGEPMTEAELRIRGFLRRGFTRPQIAEAMNMRIKTVNTHVCRIKQKGHWNG